MMGVNFAEAATAYEGELGEIGEDLRPGPEKDLRDIVARVYEITRNGAVGLKVGDFENQREHAVIVQGLTLKPLVEKVVH